MQVTTGIGLTSAQAAQRLAEVGANELPTARQETWPRSVLRQLTDTVVLVLLAAAALTVAMGDFADAAVIGLVIVVNTGLGAGQEVRSGRALAALAQLTAPHATVLRDGARASLPAADVVPGDVLLLVAGDIVAADASVLDSQSLQLDESLVTGESLPVDRSVGEDVTAATVVTRGHGRALVERTGGRTAIGAIGRGLQNESVALTPLQRQLSLLGRWLAIVVTVVAVLVALLNVSAGRSVDYSLALAISLAVAAIPESLPAVVSLSLAMAARRMAGAGVLVRRLAAVEALGSATVLATDKTGTLTEGRMAVICTWPTAGGDSQSLLEAGALCNDATVSTTGCPVGDPVDVALLEAARAAGIDVVALRNRNPRTAEVPFDAERATMTTRHQAISGLEELHVCKGAPEAVFALTGATREADAQANQWAARGRRVLAVASSTNGTVWRLLGLLALADPVRPNAAGVVAAFKAAGVRPVMITGDHPATAAAVAETVGLTADDTDDTGESVFARVRPTQKRQIILALQDRGEVVAMTGDGVNDAPALHAADVGVAMGRRGTEVAKQAADLVLTDDDLSSMVAAIGEGRRAYDNLRRFLHYALSGGVAEILVMLFGPLLGFAVPLRPGQILWVNLLTHGVPGVAMGNEVSEADVMTRPPRGPGDQLVGAKVFRRVLLLGVVVACCCFGSAAYARAQNAPWQSYLFVTLTACQLLIAVALRPTWAAGRVNWLLVCALAGNAALAALAVMWKPLSELLSTTRLEPHELALCAVAAIPAAMTALAQRRHRLCNRS